MSRSKDETRRDFLYKLARTAAFVPPALATLDLRRLSASSLQGKGNGNGNTSNATNSNNGNGKGKGTDGNTGSGAGNSIGSLSNSGQAVQNSSFRIQGQTPDQSAPWSPGSSTPAPWQRPPPSGTGGSD